MGNDCVKSNDEDIGRNRLAKYAMEANIKEISDDLLNASIHSDLKQKIGLTFECSNLPNMDVHSKTDAFIVMWQKQGQRLMRIG